MRTSQGENYEGILTQASSGRIHDGYQILALCLMHERVDVVITIASRKFTIFDFILARIDFGIAYGIFDDFNAKHLQAMLKWDSREYFNGGREKTMSKPSRS